MEERLIWVECPRDAMQGYSTVFSTEDKVDYLKHLLTVGFDTLDIGSFVSPKAIPQMADTSSVLDALHPLKGTNRFLVIAANAKGVALAAQHPAVDVVGFPFPPPKNFSSAIPTERANKPYPNFKNTPKSCAHPAKPWSCM